MSPHLYRRVLLVRLTSFGDVVRITGLPGAIRTACPKAEIVVVTDHAMAPLFAGAPGVDRIIVDSGAPRLLSLWREARTKMRSLRQDGGIDLAVDLQGTRASAAWVYASGARCMAGRRGKRPFWRFAITEDHHMSDVAESAAILGRLGIPVADPSPVLVGQPADQKALDLLLQSRGLPARGFLVVNAFCRWATKTWPAEHYARLLPRLRADFGLPLIVTGSSAEAGSANRLIDALPPQTAVSLAGRLTLGELVCLLQRARLVLTGDSGPMHAAAAAGTPVVALFGSSWSERGAPWGPGHRVLQRWRPASHHAYRDPDSAIGMAAIEINDVYSAIAEALSQAEPVAGTRSASFP